LSAPYAEPTINSQTQGKRKGRGTSGILSKFRIHHSARNSEHKHFANSDSCKDFWKFPRIPHFGDKRWESDLATFVSGFGWKYMRVYVMFSIALMPAMKVVFGAGQADAII
jgi:hypothetical protein